LRLNSVRGRREHDKFYVKTRLPKNTKRFTVRDPKTGRMVTTIPDSIGPKGETHEFKSGGRVSMTKQLRAQAEVSRMARQKPVLHVGMKANPSKSVRRAFTVIRHNDIGKN
jgi:hypothetical protein